MKSFDLNSSLGTTGSYTLIESLVNHVLHHYPYLTDTESMNTMLFILLRSVGIQLRFYDDSGDYVCMSDSGYYFDINLSSSYIAIVSKHICDHYSSNHPFTGFDFVLSKAIENALVSHTPGLAIFCTFHHADPFISLDSTPSNAN